MSLQLCPRIDFQRGRRLLRDWSRFRASKLSAWERSVRQPVAPRVNCRSIVTVASHGEPNS